MDNKEQLKLNMQSALKELGVDLELSAIVIDNSKSADHGDFASNVALKYARSAGKTPLEFANALINELDMNFIEKVEIAGPGFINFFMKKDSLTSVIKKIISENDNYGRGENKNFKINVEFVSANPTGLLHVGTARGAAYGDSLSRILEFAGYDVTREYYINDAGVQIKHLGESAEARYKELLGLPFELPEEGYHGEDVINIVKKIREKYGDLLFLRDGHHIFLLSF